MDRDDPIRVLFLNRSYWPDSEATGQLLTQLCEDLAESFEVEVLTGHPNHVAEGTAWNHERSSIRNGVTIRRVSHFRCPKSSLVGRLLNMVSFTLAAFWAVTWVRRPDIMISETDPFFLPFVAAWGRIRHRCVQIAYLQDIYPDVAVAVDMVNEGRLTRTLRWLLWSVYKKCRRVIVLSEEMRQRCIEYGVRPDRCVVIPNWADTQQLQPTQSRTRFRERHGIPESQFVVMYSGNHGRAHDFRAIMQAMILCQEQGKEVLFTFVGAGVRKAELMKQARGANLNNVLFFDYQPREELCDSLSAADVQLVSVDEKAIHCVAPSKVYGIYAVGRPVIAVVDPKSSLAQEIEQQKLGFVCDVSKPRIAAKELIRAIDHLAKNPGKKIVMGSSARELAEKRYSRQVLTRVVARLLVTVKNGSSSDNPTTLRRPQQNHC